MRRLGMLGLFCLCIQSFASADQHAILYNQVLVPPKAEEGVGVITMRFQDHDAIHVKPGVFAVSPEQHAWQPMEASIQLKRFVDRHTWVRVSLPPSCVTPIPVGMVRRVEGRINPLTIRCRTSTSPASHALLAWSRLKTWVTKTYHG